MVKQIKIIKKIWRTLDKLKISKEEAIERVMKNFDDKEHLNFVLEVIREYYE